VTSAAAPERPEMVPDLLPNRHRNRARDGIRLLLCAAALLVLAVGTPAAAETPETWARQLGDPAPDVREAAFRALVKLGDTALPALSEAAKSPSPEIRSRAESAARMIRWRVPPELAVKIGDAFAGYDQKPWHQRERLIIDVAAVGGKSALPTLLCVLKDEKSPPVRRAAAVALVRLGPEGLAALQEFEPELLGLPADDPRLNIAIGNGFLEDGQYERAAAEYHKALKLAPDSEIAWYNLACAFARMKKTQEAVDALRKAADCGYRDIEWLKNDPDLDNLRDEKLYKAFIEEMEKSVPQVPRQIEP